MFHLWYWLKRRQRQETHPVVLITGCSSGIGFALAQLLHDETKYRVIATAREKSIHHLRHKFTENERFMIRPLDVTDEDQRIALIDEIGSKWGGVNILVNNAGISYRSVLEHMTEADEQRQMATNYLGAAGLIRLVLPAMRERGRGKIINVSSVSGMLAMPTMASYSASKYALEGMSEALWYEAKPLGIDVSLIQPGFIHSKSFENVVYTERSKPHEGEVRPYDDYYKYMSPFVAKLMRLSITEPGDIAKQILRVIRTANPPLWIPATIDAYVFYYLRRLLPRRLLLPLLFIALPGARRWGENYSHRRN